MKKYLQKRNKKQKMAQKVGLILTISGHILICVLCVFTGFKYLYPPPEETSFVIDFEEEIAVKPKPRYSHTAPKAEQANKANKIELVKAAEAQHVGESQNVAQESVVDDFGDVEIEKPEREEEVIDTRALFNVPKNKTDKDTLAAQTAREVSNVLSTGHPQGNSTAGKTDGKPKANLEGRHTKGSLPRPLYNVQDEGIVVVTIWVDQYGKVQKAVPGGKGSTTANKDLLNEARKAAMKTIFNQEGKAPTLQKGTITYFFILK